MAYGLPSRGQPDWDDELNNSMEALRADVQSAVAQAAVAASDAAYARNRADEVHTAVLGGTDVATAGFVNDSASATAQALSATYATLASRAKHAPAFGLYFPEAEGAVGDGVADDTAALQAALTAAAGATLHIARGRTFRTDTLTVPSNTRVSGGGTLRLKDNTAAFGLLSIPDRTDVLVEGITLDGNRAGQTTWSESRHSLHVSGASSRVTIRGCTFLNPIGDGIYVVSTAGSIPTAVDIDGNNFIGTNANRNGVTMTACTDSRIRGNYFYKMSRDDMPGAVDLEPNAVADTIRNIVISNNVFVGGGTPTLQKAVAVNNNVGSDCTGIVIANNTVRDQFKYAIAVFGNNADRTKTQATIVGNNIRGAFASAGSAAIILSSQCEATVADNDIDSTVEYGIRSVGSTFLVAGNKVKNSAIYGIELNGGAAEKGSIQNNLVEDCGTNANAAFGGIHVKGSHIAITDNKVLSSATTKTQLGLYVESGVKNYIAGNAFHGLGVRSLSCPVAPQVFGQNVYSTGFNSISGTYPPATEAWVAGDVIHNPNPAAGGGVGWVCTTAGTPGTWKSFGHSDLSTTATLDFPSVAAATAAELTITVTGAAAGDAVQLGPPAALEAGLVPSGRVSAANTVTVRLANITAAAIDPVSASWKVTVQK